MLGEIGKVRSTVTGREELKKIFTKTRVITSEVPADKNFYFYTALGKPTGIHSASIFEFSDQLNTVEAQSIQFHMSRGDFSKWLSDVIRDGWLAHEFDALRDRQLPNSKLRDKLTELSARRCSELSNSLK